MNENSRFACKEMNLTKIHLGIETENIVSRLWSSLGLRAFSKLFYSSFSILGIYANSEVPVVCLAIFDYRNVEQSPKSVKNWW